MSNQDGESEEKRKKLENIILKYKNEPLTPVEIDEIIEKAKKLLKEIEGEARSSKRRGWPW